MPSKYNTSFISKKMRIFFICVLILSSLGSLYYGLQLERTESTPISRQSLFTPTELEWLKKNPVIRVGVDPYFLPIEGYDENNQYVGITAEYLDILEQILGVEFQLVPNLTWSQALEGAQNGTIDMLSCLASTPERDQFLDFTNPYLEFPAVIITRNSMRDINGIESLIDKRVVVAENYWIHSQLRHDYPNLGLKTYPTQRQCLESVSFGENDAFISDLASASYMMRTLGLTNLRIAANSPYTLDLSIGVPHSNTAFLPILDKALTAIPDYKKQAIYEKWIRIEQKNFYETKDFWYFLAGISLSLLVILILVVLFTQSVTKELELKTLMLSNEEQSHSVAEEKLKKIMAHCSDAVVIINLSTNFYHEANAAFFRIFNHTPEEIFHHTDEDFGLWSDPDHRIRIYKHIQIGRQIKKEIVVWKTRSDVLKKGYLTSELLTVKNDTYIVFIWAPLPPSA